MARPKKNNADYFSHDANMRNNRKVKALRRKYGHAGYAIWSYLLEALTDADFFQIEWDEMNIELFSGDFDCEYEELKEVVEYCIKLKLLILEDGKLFSFSHQKRFEGLLLKRERQKNEKATAKKQNSGVIADENPQSKVKESKVNNSKEDITPREDNKQAPKVAVFFFKKELKALGVENQLADDWIKVRKLKKAANTKTAFDALVREFDKSGLKPNECVKMAVENSWSGFRETWLNKQPTHNNTQSEATIQKPNALWPSRNK